MKTYHIHNHPFGNSPDFLDELPFWSAPFGLKLLDAIEYKPNIKAIDIGSGTGFPLLEIALRLGENSHVYGIDPWIEVNKLVKEKVEFYGISNVTILEGVAEAIPAKDNYFDLITSNNGLNNVEDLDKAISECARVAKTGAQFVQTFNLDDTMFEFYGQLAQVLSYMHMYEEIEQMHQHIYQKRRPVEEVISMIRNNRFIIKDLEHCQFNYKFTNGTAFLNHHLIRRFFMESWLNIIPEAKQEIIFDAIESRLNEQSRILGGFKLSIPFVLINAIKN